MVSINVAYNMDCMEAMRKMPDKCFDLAVVDPPYRDQSENQPTKDMRKNGTMEHFGDKPTKEYFEELFRVSKNQIIWGANNFDLPNYKGFLVWHKLTISDSFTMSMAELHICPKGLELYLRFLIMHRREPGTIHGSTPPRSQSLSTLGYSTTTPNRVTESWTPTLGADPAGSPPGTLAWISQDTRSTRAILTSRKNGLPHIQHNAVCL